MSRDKYVTYWFEESEKDASAMMSLFENGHRTWALFVGHLVLEKLLKALYVKNINIQVPRIHNLVKIARDSGLRLTDDQENFLLEVTTYNLKGRYPDYKQSFYKKATREFASDRIEQIEGMRKWLKEQLIT
ncbi:MAG: HEPN domain-containing protein [Desulfobacteraceae bacterium]|nr:HEPN domain-containing protein [Desulfobacteraceae bacterium]